MSPTIASSVSSAMKSSITTKPSRSNCSRRPAGATPCVSASTVIPRPTLPSAEMVVGERFAWGHMQKTGGDATLRLFQLFPHLILHADPRNDQAKHTPFAQREDMVRGKLLVANIRRLPAWTLSWSQHHCQHRSVQADGTPVPMRSPHQMATLPRA